KWRLLSSRCREDARFLLLSPPRGGQTLLERHLPAELTAEEKEDLLRYFGAQSVRILSDKGRLKHTAFATFPNEKAAIKALTRRLHQLKLLGHTLVVEFAKEQDRVHSPCPSWGTEKKKRSDDSVEDDKEKKLYEDYMPLHAPLPPASPQPLEEPPLPDEDEELSSKESEYESSDDEDRQRMTKLMELANLQPKRPKTLKPHQVRKKQKIKDMLNTPSASHDVFDQLQPVGNKKIEFHISIDMTPAFRKDLEKEQNCDLPAPEADASNIGFGKIFPKPNLNITEETKDDSDEMPSECISRRELEKCRISREEMETLSVFRSYEPGEPNCRIYDLKFIFGRYVDFSSETQRI
ncbi:hypothetical protein MC885_012078, partial [Smutsia gigantea]